VRRGTLLLLVATVASARDADYGAGALRARVEALRPDVEQVLGAPLGDAVQVRVATPGALEEILARELEAQQALLAGGPRGEVLREACTQQAKFLSRILLAKVDVESGAIHICPDNFRRIAEVDASWKGLLSQDVLDAVLLHEMVHVFQMRRLGLARFVRALPSTEQLTARSAVIEGHAQYVGRLAASRRGLEAAVALIDRANTEVPSSVEDPSLRHLSEVMGANLGFAYLDGEKFVSAVVAKLGYASAVQRIFSSPPATLRAVSNPSEYLEPPPPDSSLDDLAALVQRLLAERGGTTQIVPFPIPALRAVMAPAGPEVVEGAMRAFDKGLAIVSAGDPLITVGLLRGRDEEAGRTLYDADIATSKAKDAAFGRPGVQIRIVSAAYREISLGGADGLEIVKTVQMGGSRQRVETVVVRRRELVLEALVANAQAAPGDAARIAREVLEIVGGAEAEDPWDGKTGDEARKALLAALGDPHWGVRWRATRNLARMKEDAGIDEALARMLRDPDASVSCDALRGLVRRGWLDRAAAAEREALAAHGDWEVRLAYLRTMAEHDADKEAQASRLLRALEDEHPAIRAYAFGGLDGVETREARNRIPWERSLAGMEDEDEYVRAAAFRSLPFRLPAQARPVLLKALRDPDPTIRAAAALRVDQWVKESPEVFDALVAALEDESPVVRRRAAKGVADAGRAAAPAVPALCRLLDDKDAREAAAEALGEIGVADPEAMRKLLGLLGSGDLACRFDVARALRRLGHDPKDLAPVFAEQLRRGEDWDRDEGAEELGNLGEAARPHVADLVAALEDGEISVRCDAAKALGRLGSVAEEALPALDALGGQEEEEKKREPDEKGFPVIGLGGGLDDADVGRAAREAAKRIRDALAAAKR
jgi:HEAT repeat protein